MTTDFHLVTTSDPRLRSNIDQEYLFLGKWCQTFETTEQFKAFAHTFARPYGLDSRQKDHDFVTLRNLERAIFPDLIKILSLTHSSNTDHRYWNIILGHWFRRYLSIIVNRVNSLQQCLNEYNPVSTSILISSYNLVSNDSLTSILACNDDRWNHELYARILFLLDYPQLEFFQVYDSNREPYFTLPTQTSFGVKSNIIQYLREICHNLSFRMQRDNDAVLLSTYLPKWKELLLQVSMGQFPALLYVKPFSQQCSFDFVLRAQLADRLCPRFDKSLEAIARLFVFELLPACYLENFSELRCQSKRLLLPAKPRSIFLSNNFLVHDVLKIWVAEKVLNGTKYIVGQHGNHYGTHRYFSNPSIEEITSDRFITWGWSDGLEQHSPAFVLKGLNKKLFNYCPKGHLLLLEDSLPNRNRTWDQYAEFHKYFIDQQSFISTLNLNIYLRTRIRLHPAHSSLTWSDKSRWLSFDSNLKFDSSANHRFSASLKYRLFIFSYDSTGILEALSRNMPMLAFWDNHLLHLRDSALPYYQALNDAGILHFSPSSCSRHINMIWDDIPGWWLSQEVQSARHFFCQRFANPDNTFFSGLTNLSSILQF